MEYPNDSFANQLVYLCLMHLGDPNGPFVWSNAQLKAWVSVTAEVVLNGDAASQTIATSLANDSVDIVTNVVDLLGPAVLILP